MDSPPVPLNLVISPPSTKLRGMTLCTKLRRKLNGRPDIVPARSPVQRQRKFSAVRGTVSLYKAIFSRYIGPFPDTEWLKYAKIINYIFREVNLLGIWTNKSKKRHPGVGEKLPPLANQFPIWISNHTWGSTERSRSRASCSGALWKIPPNAFLAGCSWSFWKRDEGNIKIYAWTGAMAWLMISPCFTLSSLWKNDCELGTISIF